MVSKKKKKKIKEGRTERKKEGKKERYYNAKEETIYLALLFFFLSHYHVFFQELLSCLKVQKPSLCVPTMFVLLFILFCTFFLSWTSHRIVANGSVCSGFNVIDFHIA